MNKVPVTYEEPRFNALTIIESPEKPRRLIIGGSTAQRLIIKG